MKLTNFPEKVSFQLKYEVKLNREKNQQTVRYS